MGLDGSRSNAARRAFPRPPAAGRPVVICLREVSRHPLRLELDGPLERLFRLLHLTSTHFEDAEIGIGRAAQRIDLDRLFDLGDRLIEVAHPGERVAENDLRVHVAGSC